MEYIKLCDSDYRFMCVVWEHAAILWIAHLTDHCQGLSQHFLEERKFPKKKQSCSRK